MHRGQVVLRSSVVVCLFLATLAPAACSSDGQPATVVAGTSGSGGSGGNAPSKGGGAGTTGMGGNASSGAAGTSAGGANGGASAGKPGVACTVAADCKATTFATKPAGCAEGYCDAGVCRYRTVDADGDGARTNRCAVVSDGGIVVELGIDCDDEDPKINPAAWDGPAGEGHADACNDGVD